MTQTTQAERIATFVHFRRLADDARPVDDVDYGSERQLNAENLFFTELDIKLPTVNDDAFRIWCLKATSEEMLDEAMRKIGDHLAVISNRHLVSMDEITEFLRQQAEGRAPENDEAGLLLHARDLIIKGMQEPMNNIRTLTCACCGGLTKGRQWFNRDDGFGICARCAAWIESRDGADVVERDYGRPGIHHSLGDDK